MYLYERLKKLFNKTKTNNITFIYEITITLAYQENETTDLLAKKKKESEFHLVLPIKFLNYM